LSAFAQYVIADRIFYVHLSLENAFTVSLEEELIEAPAAKSVHRDGTARMQVRFAWDYYIVHCHNFDVIFLMHAPALYGFVGVCRENLAVAEPSPARGIFHCASSDC
jgi:hypothetical protein